MTDTPTLSQLRSEFGELGPSHANPTSAAQLLKLARQSTTTSTDSIEPDVPPTNDVPQKPANNHHYRRWFLAIGSLTAMAAVGLLTLSLSANDDALRARGQLTMPAVAIEAVLDGANRRLSSGDKVPAGGKVVFRISGGAEGFLTMTENGQPMVPTQSVSAGAAWLGGKPQAWAPDDLTHRTKTYQASWCPEERPDQRCSTTEMTLSW